MKDTKEESPACDYREGCGTVDCTCEKESPKTNTDMKNQGLIKKYNIQKSNGEPVDPRSEFFVLRLDPFGEMNHVKACRKAVNVYANAIEHFIPELAKDLRERYPFEESPKEEEEQTFTIEDMRNCWKEASEHGWCKIPKTFEQWMSGRKNE